MLFKISSKYTTRPRIRSGGSEKRSQTNSLKTSEKIEVSTFFMRKWCVGMAAFLTKPFSPLFFGKNFFYHSQLAPKNFQRNFTWLIAPKRRKIFLLHFRSLQKTPFVFFERQKNACSGFFFAEKARVFFTMSIHLTIS